MDPHEFDVTVRILDTKTGLTTTMVGSVYLWTEGNGSCDCNRGGLFDVDVGDICRAERFRIMDVEPMPAGYSIDEFNTHYPVRDGE